jgi:uncharacterized protein YjbI with pentapeptide repeats
MDQPHPFAERDHFEDETFTNLELPNADLSGKAFVRCTFRKLTLPETIWKGAQLEECVFDACDLTRMRPANMAARGVEFLNCRMMGIDWTNLRANPAMRFDSCNLQYASFVSTNLTGSRFSHCRLVEVQFIDARLVEVEFGDSDLRGSRFEGCDVRQADFSGTEGFFIDSARNKVKDARISVATAVMLATSLGLRVSGFSDDADEATAKGTKGARRR